MLLYNSHYAIHRILQWLHFYTGKILNITWNMFFCCCCCHTHCFVLFKGPMSLSITLGVKLMKDKETLNTAVILTPSPYDDITVFLKQLIFLGSLDIRTRNQIVSKLKMLNKPIPQWSTFSLISQESVKCIALWRRTTYENFFIPAIQNFTQITAHLSKGEKCVNEIDRAYCWAYVPWPVSSFWLQWAVSSEVDE